MGLFSSKSSGGSGGRDQLEAGKTRLRQAERELRGRRDTGDRVADRKIRERMEQDVSVARANVRDMGRWA